MAKTTTTIPAKAAQAIAKQQEVREPEIVEQASSALAEITRGEVDMQVTTAKKYPRDIARFKRDAESMATLDTETAEACFYVFQRGGKNIEGPGVRLAEIIASCWGNLRCEARVTDEDGSFVTAQGTCWDMERNVLVRMESRRRITDKSGHLFSEDMRAVTGNAAASIAFRNAVFKVVPNAFTRSIYEKARKVAVGDERTLADRRAKAIQWFNKAGVSTERVLLALGKTGVEGIDLDALGTLQGMRTAIAEGTASIDSQFPPAPLPSGTSKLPNAPQKTAQSTKPGPVEVKGDDQAEAFGFGPPPLTDDELAEMDAREKAKGM